MKIFIRKLRNIDFAGWKSGTVIFEIDVFSVIFLNFFFFFEASYKRRIIIILQSFGTFIRKLRNI